MTTFLWRNDLPSDLDGNVVVDDVVVDDVVVDDLPSVRVPAERFG